MGSPQKAFSLDSTAAHNKRQATVHYKEESSSDGHRTLANVKVKKRSQRT